MRRPFCNGLILMALVLMAALTAAGCGKTEDFSKKPKYLKSATYFGGEWAVNFWNSEDDHLEEELRQIQEDGFNSIILVVPWREFQPGLEPVSYNEYAFEKLDRVMEAAKEQGLWVSLRIGYTWDYWPDGQDVRERFRNLMGDEAVLAAWDDYVKTLYERASSHGNLYGGFITWEDFWSFTYYAKSLGDTLEGIRWAQFSGYTEYIRSHYTLEELSVLYGQDTADFDSLYLPQDNQPAVKLLYEFFDQWLNGFLLHNQEIFPDLSMEVRMDADPIPDEDGEMYWYGHEATYACENASYTALMYGVPIGHINEGERLEAGEAAAKSQEMLDEVLRSTDGKLLYIEQFLYMDNTPGFEHNAQVKEDQVADYILAMADVLKSRITGYGVWTYKNYGNNLLYNPQFALGEAGWEFEGGARVVEYDGSGQAELVPGAVLRNAVASEGVSTRVRFTADAQENVQVTVSLGGETQTVTAEGGQVTELVFENGGSGLCFSSSGLCYIDNVKVYTHVQEGQLYDLDGEEGACIEAVRKLNRKLR
ncbi:MAG: hypothetical protein HFI38_05295 [Lachnospiraceae bacterium]|jgi:hypothetical protein|nr:hypothetical protein [Lachnospiraceae bacterium]